MAEILVSGYYGFYNAGDEAILAGIIRSVRELAPETTFTAISGKAAWTRSLHGVEAVSRGDFRHIWQAVGRADLVMLGGGTLLQDVTSSKSLTYYLGIVSMGKTRFKPVMLYAQGAGPVRRPLGKTLIPAVINWVDAITLRDAESAETLHHLGVRRPPTTVTADAALALGPSDPDFGRAQLQQAGLDPSRPVIGVSVRPWKQPGASLEPPLAAALDRLAVETGAQIAFIPMQRHNDVQAAQVVASLMEHRPVLVQGDFTFPQVMAMVAACDLMVGMRYHALVFAAMNGVPLVGLSYDPKNDSFLRQIGEEAAGPTWRLDAETVVTLARKSLSDAAAVKARLRERMAALTPLSKQNARLAVELLKRRGRL